MGVARFGRDTWRDGLNLDDALCHILDHLYTYAERLRRFKAGEYPDPRTEDDDLAAAAWGCFALMEYQDQEEEE